MKHIRKFSIKYKYFLIILFILCFVAIFNHHLIVQSLSLSLSTFRKMLLFIPPIFILLGLLDVWVPREIMMRFMGEGSGLKGIVLAIFIGSAAAGPLYGAFPVAAVFMKKGVKFMNVLIFLGAWSTTKIPMVLFEISALGLRFALTRLLLDIPGIIIMSYIISKLISSDEINAIYSDVDFDD